MAIRRYGWMLILFGGAALARGAEPAFDTDVAPLLVRHCLGCHNGSELAGGLDLATREKAKAGGESGEAALTPGDLEHSGLVERIRSGEMPPEGKGMPVPAADLARLEAWIQSGAAWPEGRTLSAFDFTTEARAGRDWWSLRVPAAPAIPMVKHRAWVRTPIDAFVLARLEGEGLAPNGDAPRATFLRRAMLDLHGLPPTPQETEAFVADVSPDAYEKLIDRLLASPRYGERWARHWLDVARFGESNGYETNTARGNAWPYRDWVISALNDDLPYPEFVLHQLAGDQTGVDAATGFLVGGAHDTVGSPDIELTLQQRANDLDDMISTTSTAFLGLTAGCAKCHDHKFDPISQRDYYSLQAMFAGVQHGAREMRTPDYEQRKRTQAKLQEELARRERELNELAARHQPLAQLGSSPEPVRPAVSPRWNVDRFAPVRARYLKFTVAATNNVEPCIDELEVFAAEDAKNVALAANGAKATASSIYAGGTSKIHRLEHINDGRYGNGRSWISAEIGAGWVQIEWPETATIDRVVWARDREGQYRDRLATQYRIEVSETGDTWQLVATAEDRAAFDSETNAGESPITAGLPAEAVEKIELARGEIEKLRQALAALAPTQAYLGTFTQPEMTHVLYRGEPLQKREQVLPGAIAAVGRAATLPADAPEAERRLALAQWIGSEDNPLAARVIVNRIWHYHFGQGLVRSPSDFGFNGGLPSHPELLDHLATQLIASGWKLKTIHRQIMLSSVYRQASTTNAAAVARDVQARLLWRFNPRRLEAEAIRDCVLATSGVLDLRMGGPGYDAFEPNGNYVKVYTPKQNFGPAEWRRMVYQEKPRSRQDGVFGEFDCPDASQAMAKRNISTTALQALNLLNGGFMIQQAELFAERLSSESPDAAEQIRRAFRRSLAREPDAAEQAAAEQLVREHGLPAFCRALLNANEFLYLN